MTSFDDFFDEQVADPARAELYHQARAEVDRYDQMVTSLRGEPSTTDVVVREAVGLITDIAYFCVADEDEVRILFIRPWGRRGQGIWLRRVLEGPSISPPWKE